MEETIVISQQEIDEKRREVLKKWKIARLAELADRKATISFAYNKEMEKLNGFEKEVQERAFIDSSEGSQSFYR